MRIAGVRADCNDRGIVHDNGVRSELFQDPLLEVVFGQRRFVANVARRLGERFLGDAVNHPPGIDMRLQLLWRPAGLKLLHQVGRADDLAAQSAHHLDRPGIHHGDVGDGIPRRILHGHFPSATQQPRQVLAQLLLPRIHELPPRQAIEHPRFDAVNQFARRAPRRDQVEPPACGHAFCRQGQYALADGVAVMEVVEKPSVEGFGSQFVLDGFDVRHEGSLRMFLGRAC